MVMPHYQNISMQVSSKVPLDFGMQGNYSRSANLKVLINEREAWDVNS